MSTDALWVLGAIIAVIMFYALYQIVWSARLHKDQPWFLAAALTAFGFTAAGVVLGFFFDALIDWIALALFVIGIVLAVIVWIASKR